MAGFFVQGRGARVAAVEEQSGRTGASQWLGDHGAAATLLIAATATTFALGSTVIRFAYDAGAGTLTIVTVRTTIAAAALALLLWARGVKVRLDRRELWAVPLIGLFMAGYSGAFYEGMEYMPVALTVLTFYTYPLITGTVGWLTGRERFGAAGAAALPLAFVGLVLALDVTGGGFSLRGAAWALLGAAGFSAVLVLSGLLLPPRSDTRPRTLVMLATASIATILASLATGEVWFPQSASGWSALLGSALCYAVAMTSILYCASVLGATRVAVVMNIEPLASIVLTFLILGERMRPMQLFGAALVIGAIFLFRPERRGLTASAGRRSRAER
jgi:drug/metabolite transporter (DMT)-like permease